MSGAAMVVRTLKDIGVKHVFGYPGGAVLDIYDALYAQEDVEHVLVRHEQAAAHKEYAFKNVKNVKTMNAQLRTNYEKQI